MDALHHRTAISHHSRSAQQKSAVTDTPPARFQNVTADRIHGEPVRLGQAQTNTKAQHTERKLGARTRPHYFRW